MQVGARAARDSRSPGPHEDSEGAGVTAAESDAYNLLLREAQQRHRALCSGQDVAYDLHFYWSIDYGAVEYDRVAELFEQAETAAISEVLGYPVKLTSLYNNHGRGMWRVEPVKL